MEFWGGPERGYTLNRTGTWGRGSTIGRRVEAADCSGKLKRGFGLKLQRELEIITDWLLQRK
jgi:hypothetical protein